MDRGTVSKQSPAKITLNSPHRFIVESSEVQERTKGLAVRANGQISVTAYNSYSILAGSSIGAFRLYSQSHLKLSTCTYISINYGGSSFILIVGAHNSTTVTIKPTVELSLKHSELFAANETSLLVVHEYATLLLLAEADLTGTVITSNKPLTVITGSQCGNVPMGYKGCDHFVTQIPPTASLGLKHFLVPIPGRTSGQLITVIPVYNHTLIEHDCGYDDKVKGIILGIEDVHRFNTSFDQYCILTSNKPVFVSQLSFGYETDGNGDPALTVVPSVEQYISEVDFVRFDHHSKQFITMVALAEKFNPQDVLMDSEILYDCAWVKISSQTYSCAILLPSGSHTITHINGKLLVMIYGFEKGHGYAYSAGTALNIFNSGKRKHNL